MTPTRTCKTCDTPLGPGRPKAVYCGRAACYPSSPKYPVLHPCEACGDEFVGPRTTRTCSMACRETLRLKADSVRKECAECGTTYTGTGKSVTCSALCGSRRQRKARRVTKTCEVCSAVYLGQPESRSCSKPCAVELRRRGNIGERICETCDTAFRGHSTALYCTPACSPNNKATSRNGRLMCRRCGEEFEAPRGSQQGYCSDLCNPNTRRRALDELDPPGLGRKRCSRCEKVQLLNKFHTDRSRSDDLNVWCKGCVRAYQRANPQTQSGRSVRVAANDSAQVPYTLEDLEQRAAMWGGRCWRCGIAGARTWDHVIPLAKGGPDCLANMRPCCRSCNSSKNATWPLPADELRPRFRHPSPAPGVEPPVARVGLRWTARPCQRPACDRAFFSRHSKQRFCSNSCARKRAHRKGMRERDVVCRDCGVAFRTSSSRRVSCETCSPPRAVQAARAAARRVPKPCDLCDELFVPRQSRQRYCGNPCDHTRALAGSSLEPASGGEEVA